MSDNLAGGLLLLLLGALLVGIFMLWGVWALVVAASVLGIWTLINAT